MPIRSTSSSISVSLRPKTTDLSPRKNLILYHLPSEWSSVDGAYFMILPPGDRSSPGLPRKVHRPRLSRIVIWRTDLGHSTGDSPPEPQRGPPALLDFVPNPRFSRFNLSRFWIGPPAACLTTPFAYAPLCVPHKRSQILPWSRSLKVFR